jgi:hypothetical protein
MIKVWGAGARVNAILRTRRDFATTWEFKCVVQFPISDRIVVQREVLISRVIYDDELLLGIHARDERLVFWRSAIKQLGYARVQLDIPSEVHVQLMLRLFILQLSNSNLSTARRYAVGRSVSSCNGRAN